MVDRLGTDDLALSALLESFVGLVPDACLAALPNGRLLAANKKASALYGYPVSRLLTMGESDLVARGSPGLFPHDRKDLLDGVVIDTVHQDASAALRPVRVSALQNDLLGRDVVIMTVLDDCEPADAEERRVKSVAFDAVLDSIVVHDLNGNLLHFNRAAADHSGMTPEEFARIGPWGWVPPSTRPVIPARLAALFEKGSHVFESSGTRPDGTTYANEVHARLITTNGKHVIVSIFRDVSERLRAEKALHELAYHDALTGLPNRMALNERAEQAMADAGRHGDPLGLAFVDINEFKAINDHIGHSAGDDVLRTIAQRLVSAVRAADTVARFGGDEFVLMLPRLSDRADLERVGAKIAAVVSGRLHVQGHAVDVTASVGLAIYDPAEDGFSSLLSKADMAMYSAKRAGEAWRVFDDRIVLR